MQEDEGPDFTVFRFSEPRSGDFFGVYVGHNPDRFSKDEEPSGTVRTGRVSNIQIVWREWVEKGTVRSKRTLTIFTGRMRFGTMTGWSFTS
jgi:hypothetical protein